MNWVPLPALTEGCGHGLRIGRSGGLLLAACDGGDFLASSDGSTSIANSER